MENGINFNEKQRQIMEVAEELFSVKGFEGTSVRDIAEAASINLAMISYYFGSKEKLMEALFEYRTAHVRVRLENLIKDESKNELEKLFLLIDEQIGKFFEMQCFHRVMLNEQLINKNSVITKSLKELKRKNLENITQIIKDGQEKGLFRKEVDQPFLMFTMIGTISQAVMNQQFYREYTNNYNDASDEDFKANMKKNLSTHIKAIFKSILIHEA